MGRYDVFSRDVMTCARRAALRSTLRVPRSYMTKFSQQFEPDFLRQVGALLRTHLVLCLHINCVERKEWMWR